MWSLHGFFFPFAVFHLRFGCKLWLLSIQTHARQSDIIYKLLHATIWRCCAVLFKSDSLFSGKSLIKICCFAQESIQNMLICSYALFLPRDKWMNAPKIELSDGSCFGQQQLLAYSIDPLKISFHMKKNKWHITARNSQSIKVFLTLKLCQNSKSASSSMFSSSKPVSASNICCQLGNSMCCASHSYPGVWPQELGHWSCSQNRRHWWIDTNCHPPDYIK